MYRKLIWVTVIYVAMLAIALVVGGCQQAAPSSTPAAKPAAPATSAAAVPGSVTGTLSGTITNSLTNAPVSGAAITTDPVIQGVTIATKADGTYSADLPVGAYAVTVKKDNFKPATQSVSLIAGKVTKNVALAPTAPVVVNLGKALTAAPGASVTIKAAVDTLDGSTVKTYEWSQSNGAKAALADTSLDTVKVTLGSLADYKALLIKGLEQQERFQVQAINPHSLTAAQTVTLKLTVTTSSGKYTATQTVTSALGYATTTGVADVPINVPVLLHGKTQKSYRWTIAAPTGSKAAIDGPADQNPTFVPDAPGKYTLTESTSGVAVTVYAGTWEGAVTGQDASGKPVSAGCVICHNDKIAPDQFKDWKNTGHAAIFTKNVNNPAGHYGEDCLVCHTVGFNKSASNGGSDDQPDYAGLVSSGLLTHGAASNYATILSKFPKTAQFANIQCENCHGPNKDTGLHGDGKIDPARISLSSDVCGSCHGEPLRHGRFQQWEESGHGNFELAIDDATVEARGATAGHCGRCHTAQGFLAWTAQGDLTKQIQGKNGNATVEELTAMGLTKDQVQPQTCVVCHDPHAEGASSGKPNTASVRITGSTSALPAGYTAKDVGRGAICITCHNTRNLLHNDDNPPSNYTAPHVAAQGDVLMGQNAYFVTPGERSPHSFITDTCATCHMEATPAPPEFSLEGVGTNHGFKASGEICGTCHTKQLSGDVFRAATLDRLAYLGTRLSANLMGKIPASVTVLDYTPHKNNNKDYDLKSDKVVLDKSNIASIVTGVAGGAEPAIHGQESFTINLKNAVQVTYSPQGAAAHTVSLNKIQVQLGDITTDGKTALVAPADALVKAAWNYYLIHGDSSGGIHNPAYVTNILNASLAALK